jgi:hypothetical protein
MLRHLVTQKFDELRSIRRDRKTDGCTHARVVVKRFATGVLP